MVFQSASLMPWRTVLRNVTYGLEMQNVPLREATRRAQAMIELVGLTGFENRHPGELSGGMQQRVNLARALVIDPEVILLDEPFAALDAQTRELMQTELLRVWDATKKNGVFITHQISEAVYLADRVVVMSARPGRVKAIVPIDIPRPRPGQRPARSAHVRDREPHLGADRERRRRGALRMTQLIETTGAILDDAQLVEREPDLTRPGSSSPSASAR